MAEKIYYPSAPPQEISVVEQNQSDSLYPNLNQPGLVYDKNIIELEQSISNIFKKYKIQKNDKTSYKNMLLQNIL